MKSVVQTTERTMQISVIALSRQTANSRPNGRRRPRDRSERVRFFSILRKHAKRRWVSQEAVRAKGIVFPFLLERRNRTEKKEFRAAGGLWMGHRFERRSLTLILLNFYKQ